VSQSEEIIEANKIDLKEAEARGVRGALLDRLMLDTKRIGAMAKGLE
jgi:glutamate-5-semialdehyde dehydrogenase